MRILDIIGACLPVGQMELSKPMLRATRVLGTRGESSIIGTRDRLSVVLAGLVNGTHAHSLDFDDTHPNSTTHGSSCIVPTVLAMGERSGSTGREVITAAVAGWETIVRLGEVAPSRLTAHGFRPTSICGTISVALTAGKIMGLSPKRLTHAVGISGSFASGLNEFITDGLFDTKRLHSGWAVYSGISSAIMAEQGLTGPAAILEGEFGLYRAHLDRELCDFSKIEQGLGETWETLNTAFKPYPACHFMHAFIDCAQVLREEVSPSQIDRVIVRVAEPIIKSICEPRSVKVPPRSEYDAKFSLQFVVGAMLVEGRVGVDTFLPDKISDQSILAIAEKVQHVVDPEASFPDSYPGWVEVKTCDGRTLEHKQDVTRGGPGYPMTRKELHDKFRSNARLVLSARKTEKLLEMVDNLEDLTDLSSLMELCRV